MAPLTTPTRVVELLDAGKSPSAIARLHGLTTSTGIITLLEGYAVDDPDWWPVVDRLRAAAAPGARPRHGEVLIPKSFAVVPSVYEAAKARAAREGWPLAEVVRALLDGYAAGHINPKRWAS